MSINRPVSVQEEQKQACLRAARGYPARFPFKPSTVEHGLHDFWMPSSPSALEGKIFGTCIHTRKCADRNALAHRCSRDRKHFRLEASSSMVCERPHVSWFQPARCQKAAFKWPSRGAAAATFINTWNHWAITSNQLSSSNVERRHLCLLPPAMLCWRKERVK